MAAGRLGRCLIRRIAFGIADTVFPKIEFSTAKEFFADLTQELPNLKVPTWKDELYFEYHRGVYTSQAETKQRIRRNEELMLNAEKYASLASLFGRPYPQDRSSSRGRICCSIISTTSCLARESR